MKTLFVLMKCALGKAEEVGNAIVDLGIEGVEVYSITGPYDLLVKAHFADVEEIADTVQDKLHRVPGVLDTNTFVSFRMYGHYSVF
ncbi:MAG: Lrp/AsnC family transcriptional regulator [Rhodomicrobiaceae bacterium]